MESTSKARKPPRKFKLETREDVIHYLGETVRSLRRLVVMDKDLDPIRISKQKTLVYALSKMAEQLSVQGLEAATDDALSAEVIRREQLKLAASRGNSVALNPTAPTH